MDKEIHRLEMMTKVALDQLLSLLNEIDEKDLTRLQEVGKETITKSDLPPGIKSSVNAIFFIGCAITALAKKEKEHDEENEDVKGEGKDEDKDQGDDDQGEQNQSGLS